jgi:hypothetical protein
MKFQEVRFDAFVRVLVGIERMRKLFQMVEGEERMETELTYARCTLGTGSKLKRGGRVEDQGKGF